MTNKKDKLVEIARSFSYKMSMPKYENRDFFCSQKCECTEEEAEAKSEQLYNFCKKEVLKSVAAYLEELKPKPIDMTKAIEMGEQFKKNVLEVERIENDSKLDDARLGN